MKDNSIAEGFLAQAQEKKEELAILLEDQKKAVNTIIQEMAALREKAKQTCTHPNTRREVWYDYHKGEENSSMYCSICDKLLRTY